MLWIFRLFPILEKLIEVNENHKIKSIVISSTDHQKKNK